MNTMDTSIWTDRTARWVTDPEDERLQAEPRGTGAIATGGWRCAGAMGFFPEQREAMGDHAIAVPFYDAGGDPRHSCYCVACALACLGLTPP